MISNDVLILGAGFSRAISEAMPLTDELGDAAIEFAGLEGNPGLPGRPFSPAFSFESWLSLLAEDQPHLSEAENLANAALFAQLREAIHSVLTDRETSALGQEAPRWLFELITLLHHRHAKVLTLNYDVLVEASVASLGILAAPDKGVVTTNDILQNMPPLPTTFGFRFGGDLNLTFRLLKLHGSLDWFAASRDPSGASLGRLEMHSTFGSPVLISDEYRRQQLPGREPFIIPPAASKSSYYQYPYTRELWRTAFEALTEAVHVSLVGYSLPPADLVMGGMISRAFGGTGVSVDVVNLEPDELANRIRRLGVGTITEFGGDDCVEDFTHAYRDRVAAEFVRELAAFQPEELDTPLLVNRHQPGIGQTQSRVAEIVPAQDGVVTLVVDGPDKRPSDATSIETDQNGSTIADTSPRLGELIAAVQGADRLVVRRDGSDETVIDSQSEFRETGVSLKWMSFDTV